MLAVLPIGHPLGNKERLKPADFHDQPFVALGSEITTRSETDVFFSSAKARPRIVAEAQLSASICELVAGGAGLSIVEPVTAVNFAAVGKVVSRPLHPEQPFRYALLLPALRKHRVWLLDFSIWSKSSSMHQWQYLDPGEDTFSELFNEKQ